MTNVRLSSYWQYHLVEELKILLKNVPDGKRLRLPKDITELLLFTDAERFCSTIKADKERVKVERLGNAKFIYFSGPLLARLDLSEISFDNVVWSKKSIIDNLYQGDKYVYDEANIYFSSAPYTSFCDHDFSFTNAFIDFSNGFTLDSTGCIFIDDCKFRGLDLSISGLDCVTSISNCSFSEVDLNGVVLEDNCIKKSSFDNTGVVIVDKNSVLQEPIDNKQFVRTDVGVPEFSKDIMCCENETELVHLIKNSFNTAELVPTKPGRRY